MQNHYCTQKRPLLFCVDDIFKSNHLDFLKGQSGIYFTSSKGSQKS